MLARLAEAGGLELRIFERDGQKVGREPRADPAESPNADIVNKFLNEKDGQTFQSVPTGVFLTKDFGELYRYIEFRRSITRRVWPRPCRCPSPARAPSRPGRDSSATGALQQMPFFQLWASAAVDEMISALHERLVVGPRSAS
jgi:hypothetical protein